MIGLVVLLALAAAVFFIARHAVQAYQADTTTGPIAAWPSRTRPARPEPRMPTVLDLMESRTCEVCSSAPRIQFANAETGSRLEFCRHHGNRNERALLSKGYSISLDGRDL